MNAALDACEITVSVGPKLLLDHVSLRVMPGETVALIGPNGAGKSTFLRVMSGELRPDHGAVLMQAREIGTFSPAALALRRAVLAQSITVNFPFTVAEIVRMGAGGRQGATIDAQIERRARDRRSRRLCRPHHARPCRAASSSACIVRG